VPCLSLATDLRGSNSSTAKIFGRGSSVYSSGRFSRESMGFGVRQMRENTKKKKKRSEERSWGGNKSRFSFRLQKTRGNTHIDK
jgi:hypothetical protein